MEPELEPELPRAERGRHPWVARGKRWGGLVLSWTPVWVPLVFLLQMLGLGLWPTRVEAARLERAGAEVRARAAALEQEEQALASEARMLEDPVYQERVRRSLLDPAAVPLTLERARAGRTP